MAALGTPSLLVTVKAGVKPNRNPGPEGYVARSRHTRRAIVLRSGLQCGLSARRPLTVQDSVCRLGSGTCRVGHRTHKRCVCKAAVNISDEALQAIELYERKYAKQALGGQKVGLSYEAFEDCILHHSPLVISQKEVREMFDAIDTDKDGVVEVVELHMLLEDAASGDNRSTANTTLLVSSLIRDEYEKLKDGGSPIPLEKVAQYLYSHYVSQVVRLSHTFRRLPLAAV